MDVSMLQKQVHEKKIRKKRMIWRLPGKKSGPPKVWLGIESGTGSQQKTRRMEWRHQLRCGEKLHEAGIPYAFVVGMPIGEGRDLWSTDQGEKATPDEVEAANELRLESETYGDMHFVPIPDTYMELQGKTFALLEYGYNLGALYVAKTDDDVCLEPDALLQGLENYETNRSDGDALYGGYAYFKGSENIQMRGRNSEATPYFSGPGYILSRNLVQAIVKDDESNSILWAPYGSFDEDADTGRWVDYARTHHGISVIFLKMPRMLRTSAHNQPLNLSLWDS